MVSGILYFVIFLLGLVVVNIIKINMKVSMSFILNVCVVEILFEGVVIFNELIELVGVM